VAIMVFTVIIFWILSGLVVFGSTTDFKNPSTGVNVNVYLDGISVSQPRYVVAVRSNRDAKDFPNTSSLANQKKVSRAFIDAYNAWDIDGILEYRAPNCQQQTIPSSMGQAAKNNTQYRQYLETIMPLFTNFTVLSYLLMILHSN
jgi:hypothetical protein